MITKDRRTPRDKRHSRLRHYIPEVTEVRPVVECRQVSEEVVDLYLHDAKRALGAGSETDRQPTQVVFETA